MELNGSTSVVRRLAVLLAAVMMMVCLGTSHAWATFAKALTLYGLRDTETQWIFGTSIFVFCVWMIPAGRLHDRWGPRPLGVISALLVGAAYAIAWKFGQSFFMLWLSMGVMTAVGIATGYVCPIATVVKWFPGHKGLVCGIAAAGFGVGPIILSNITKALLGAGWIVYDIFGLVAATYMPIILVCGLLLATPGKDPAAVPSPVIGLRIAKERRFWLLFVGMFVGTLPYLLVTGNVERLGDNMGIGMAAAWGVTLMAIGNAAGRLFWGQALDRIGQRKAMFAAQMTMLAALLVLVILGPQPIVFLLAVAVIGFCYGSNFAIFPATVAAFYGSELLGTIYPLVMVAQSISSLGPVLNGVLIRQTGSYYWGLALAIGVAAAGLVLTWVLTRRR